MSFIGLHNHTHYSNFRLRDAIIKVPELIEYTHELGHKGVCITEHETISSCIEAQKYYFNKKKEEGWEDYKLLLGNEIYLCTSDVNPENKDSLVFPHFVLIALDEVGHRLIRELSTIAWIQNSFKSVMMRVPTYYEDLIEVLGTEEQGHVVGLTACLGGTLPKQLLKYKNTKDENIISECVNWIENMQILFGKEYFFLELQPSKSEEQIFVNQWLIKLSEMTGAKYVITTDSHYLKVRDKEVHKIYLNSQDGDREVDSFYDTTYVMSEEEIHDFLDESLGEDIVNIGINNSMLIYDMAQEYDLRKPLEIPYIATNNQEPNPFTYLKYKDVVPSLEPFYSSVYNCDRHLVREILEAFERDEYYRTQEAYDHVEDCLKVIKSSSDKMSVRWSAYLLNVQEVVQTAWEVSYVGAGRGSGVGFAILNMLGITQINPLREDVKTYYWRFMNPDRDSVLDIDIDIESGRRDAVVNHFKNKYGEDKISKVLTLGTEQSRSAIQTAARGLGYDSDLASYLSSMIVADRGQTRSLKVMYYGDLENDVKPDKQFVAEMDRYSDIFEVALKIEGLINSCGSHAGGMIMVNEPFTNSTALMKTNSGDIVTQFDLHTCEDVSLIKLDLLSIDALDKMRTCIELLIENGVIEDKGSIKANYENVVDIYKIERNDPNMWKMLVDKKVMSFFQMEKESGIQAIQLTQVDSVAALATINSVMRLMAQEKGGETPLHKFARFKKNIEEWYKEMTDYGLTKEEQQILKDILSGSSGICEAQEYLVLLTQHPKIGGFSLGWGDRLRKSVAKKKPKDFLQLEKEFFENAEEKNLSPNLTKYVWNVLISTQRGYGFNRSHTLAYSLIGLQELNLCYNYPIIYWNTANLIVDSGSAEAENEASDKATKYGKVATSIARVQSQGTKVELPVINEAQYGFKPDEKNNEIIFGLKGLNGIGTDVAKLLIENRPYLSMQDFYDRMIVTGLIKPAQMVKLIKAGCFTRLDNEDRVATMRHYLGNYVLKPCENLTMQQYNKMEDMGIIPKQYEFATKVKSFKDYVFLDDFCVGTWIDQTSKRKLPKCGYNDRLFELDDIAMEFFKANFNEDSIHDVVNGYYVVYEKKLLKQINEKIQPLKDWFSTEEALEIYNEALLQELWEKHASGTTSKWEMESLSFYYGEHELANLNEKIYTVADFNQLPEEPEVYDTYTRYINGEKKQMPKYKIVRLAGTVLDVNKDRHTVTLLTNHGVVNCKFNKGQFVYYYKRISGKLDPDSEKNTILEDSWLKRGQKILICGYRQDDMFRVYRYSDTIFKHSCNLITDVKDDGTLSLLTERAKI